MKVRNYFLALIVFSLCLSLGHAQEYGKIRALQQRAAYIIKKKNDFVAKALTPYAIPHERNEQGAVVRIQVDGKWLDVTGIEIVPVLTEMPGKNQQVTAHELLFYTGDGTLALLSELAIR
ncbi:MAG: hypothetical protein U1C55_12315 [Smithellaceae bacterium]|nr:hypothetical protein [Smithellaceae bacterium]